MLYDSKIITSGYKDLYFLGDNNNQVLLFGSYDIQENDKIINFDVSIDINDSRNYLMSTSMNNLSYIISNDINLNPKLYLDFINNSYTIDITANPTVKYDLIEFKINDNNWISNNKNSNKITVAKLNKKQYVQARIKVNNNYYYSKVLSIE